MLTPSQKDQLFTDMSIHSVLTYAEVKELWAVIGDISQVRRAAEDANAWGYEEVFKRACMGYYQTETTAHAEQKPSQYFTCPTCDSLCAEQQDSDGQTTTVSCVCGFTTALRWQLSRVMVTALAQTCAWAAVSHDTIKK